MSSVGEVVAPQVGAQDAGAPETDAAVMPRRIRTGRRVLAGFLAGLPLCLGVVGAGLLAWDASYEGRVLPGVRVGAVELSGLDREQAVAALAAAYHGYDDGRVVIRTEAGDVSVPYSAFSRRADTQAMVEAAMDTGRTGTVLERAVDEVRVATQGRTLEPRITLDEVALGAGVEEALSWLERKPQDATIGIGVRAIFTVPARAGRSFDAKAVAAAALDAVRRLDAPPQVVVEAAAITMPPARDTAAVLRARQAAERMLGDVVLTLGSKRWTIKAATVRGWLGFAYGRDGSVYPVMDAKGITGALAPVAKAVSVKPGSAQFLTSKSGKVVGVAASRDGRRLDDTATTAAIQLELADRGRGVPAGPVALATAVVEPQLTTEEATRSAPLMALLGSWKTWFPISERNYWGANIWLPAQIINGTVLLPGQTFEWWRAVGTPTPARGFGPGGYIAGNHTEPTGALGGGMCSSSTTLFNAALRAGLQMGARSNHRYYINRYPLGLDATVELSGRGGVTMSFTNDTSSPILIRGIKIRSGGNGWVRYEIWGVPDGRTVSLGKPVVWNFQKATTSVDPVTTLPHGVRKQTEYPADGMDTSVTRTVRDRNGKVIHRDTYISHYRLWNGRIEVGV